MQQRVNLTNFKLLVEPVIPLIIKVQRRFRRNRDREKMKDAIIKTIKIGRMFKRLTRVNMQTYFKDLEYRLNRMKSRNCYSMTERLKKREKYWVKLHERR